MLLFLVLISRCPNLAHSSSHLYDAPQSLLLWTINQGSISSPPARPASLSLTAPLSSLDLLHSSNILPPVFPFFVFIRHPSSIPLIYSHPFHFYSCMYCINTFTGSANRVQEILIFLLFIYFVSSLDQWKQTKNSSSLSLLLYISSHK